MEPWFAALARPHRSGSLRGGPQQRLGLAHLPSRRGVRTSKPLQLNQATAQFREDPRALGLLNNDAGGSARILNEHLTPRLLSIHKLLSQSRTQARPRASRPPMTNSVESVAHDLELLVHNHRGFERPQTLTSLLSVLSLPCVHAAAGQQADNSQARALALKSVLTVVISGLRDSTVRASAEILFFISAARVQTSPS